MKYKLFTTKLKHSGIFDLKDAYRVAHDWLVDEGYEIEENKYMEVVTGAKEVQIFWTAKDKLSDYFTISLDVKFHILGMSNVEMEKDGVKIKKNKGTFEFHVTGNLERDPKGKWDNKPYKFLRKLYDSFLISDRIERYEQKVLRDVEDLVAYMKSYLSLSV